MKNTIKGFIAGIIVMTLIIIMTLPALALTGNQTITAAYSNIKIYVNQNLVTPKDAAGNTVEPFIYNGTTYLPVRAVADALGQQVGWDANTKSVYIGTQPAIQSTQPVDASQIAGKLEEINNWLVGDIWNNGFCDIRDYISKGTNSIGQQMDIDFTLSQLDNAMTQKTEYDSYINGLPNTADYAQIKSIWAKVSAETNKLYAEIEARKPVANDSGNPYNSDLFEQYLNAFYDAVNNLD